MSEVSPQKLFKKIQLSSNVKLISDFFSHSKIKASKQIYNLETRNIKLFIKQQKQMQSKRKQELPLPKRSINLKGRYDQNQLLELQYNIKKSQQKPVYIERCQTQPTQITSNSDRKHQKLRQPNKIITLKNLQSLQSSKIFINRPKRVTYIQPIPLNKSTDNSSQNLPRIVMRKKSKSTFQELDKKFKINDVDLGSKLRLTNLSQSEQSLKKSSSSIMQFSSKVISKRKQNLSVIQETNDKLIQITDDKMTRYLKSLHILINGSYEYGISLDEQKANSLIIERYSPQRKGSCLKESINKDIQNKQFQFPYLEFISQAQTRKSIHRIINMSVKNTQRVVFKLLDFNRNEFIDQKDLIDLIQLSQKIPDLRPDLLKIANFVCKSQKFSISNANSMSYRQDSQRQIQRLQDIPQRYETIKTPKKQNKLNPANISKLGYIRERANTVQSSQMTQFISQRKFVKKQSNFGSSTFSKQKLYSFFQTKNKFFNSNKNKDQFRFTVNQQDFHKIFSNERPSTFNDILKFLFHIKSQDLIRQINDQAHSDSKLSKKHIKIKKDQKQGFKNYDVPSIIKGIEKKFECNIEMSKYQDVLHIAKISQRNIKID